MLQQILLAGVLACFIPASWAAHGLLPAVPEPLRELIEQVQRENPAILAAQAAVAAAHARGEAAGRPLYNPSLSLDTENGQTATTAAGISQTLDWSGKQASLRNAALGELQAAQAALAVTQQRVIAETLSALADYQTAREQEALGLQRSRLMQEFVDTATRRLSAGDISRMDVALAQVAYNEALMQQAHAEAALSDAQAALSAASGLAPQAAWPTLPEKLPLPPENANPDTLLNRLPEIRLALARAAAAHQRIEVAKRQRRPDPTLTVRGGRDGSDPLIGIGIEIPLFVRNPFRAEVAAAESEAMQAEQGLNETRSKDRARLEGALARYRRTAAAWQTWQTQGRPNLDAQMALLARLWQAGELSATEYLVQTRQGVDTQITAAELSGEVRRAAVAWLQSSGLLEDWLGISLRSAESRP